METIIIILNLFILESLLSIDNAAVLALMVQHLPQRDQRKALRWGMWGAFILRGACLFAATILITQHWLVIIGGLYLLWLSIGHFSSKIETEEEKKAAGDSKLYRWAGSIGISQLWATIILVEWMDLVFSMDNVFAAVALSSRFWVVIIGVVLGIITMRFIATQFLSLMDKYPSLTTSAYIVVGLLGVKLVLTGVTAYVFQYTGGWVWIHNLLEQHNTNLIFSGVMMLIFFAPFLFRKKKQVA